jgi:AraC family transcriptional regulator
VHGDIDIIPGRHSGHVGDKRTRHRAGVKPVSRAPGRVAVDLDLDPCRLEIRNRFLVRDAQLENIGWALKAEMESGYPSGHLFVEGLALSVATRLVRSHSSRSLPEPGKQNGRLSDSRLRQVVSYIEANLSQDISLGDIAAVAGVSVSHFKSLFRESVGLPAHQYLIRRRVERAKSLLYEGKLSVSQIALETGFAHQSHLAHHMRRLLGVSPKKLRDMTR